MSMDTSLDTFADTSSPRRGRIAVTSLGLAALALVHVLAAISFIVVLAIASGKAHAAEATAPAAVARKAAAPGDLSPKATDCAGRDLLAAMARENPRQLAAIRKEAAATPNGTARFWKIERTGVAPSWLYGTMHVTDPRVLDLPAAAHDALAQSGTVVIETADILDQSKAQAELLAKPQLTMFTDGKTLADYLSPAQLALLKTGLAERGLSFQLVSHMKPWMLASFVALPACEAARAQSGTDILDKTLAEKAKAAGKDVVGLESLDEQLQAMADLPMQFHVRGLIETLQLGSLMNDVTTTMTDLYLRSEIGTIMPMMKAVSPESDNTESSGYARFEERIITDRNAVMAKRAAPIIDKGNAFIAIGALHLPGKEGVVARLRAAGYTVTAID